MERSAFLDVMLVPQQQQAETWSAREDKFEIRNAFDSTPLAEITQLKEQLEQIDLPRSLTLLVTRNELGQASPELS